MPTYTITEAPKGYMCWCEKDAHVKVVEDADYHYLCYNHYHEYMRNRELDD